MRVDALGQGYVGATQTACFAKLGKTVIGIAGAGGPARALASGAADIADGTW